MPTYRCPKCDHSWEAVDELAGQSVSCSKCHATFQLPGKPSATRSRRSAKARFAEEDRHGSLSRPAMVIDPEELIDMTAMVDIVFFLLIFFLVTSMSEIMSSAPLPRPEVQNEDKGSRPQQTDNPKDDSNAIVVKISKDDAIEIDGVPYREIADLVIRLAQLRKSGGDETSLLVLGNGEATHGTAASVLDAGYEVGINRIRLAVVDDKAE